MNALVLVGSPELCASTLTRVCHHPAENVHTKNPAAEGEAV